VKRTLSLIPLCLLVALAAFGPVAAAQVPTSAIASRAADINGVNLHYLTAGHGTPLILLHGYAETSLMWKPIIPLLAQRFAVIAPDLPGIGDSSIPAHGLDMKTAAISIHDLAKSLGVQRAEVVSHDIGLMVAYAYAAQFPTEVTKLVLMDAFASGVPGWESIYNNPGIWHFRFNGPTPEALVQGREPTYFAYFWNDLAADKNHSIPEADREGVPRGVLPPRTHAYGWEYFVFVPAGRQRFRSAFPDKVDDPCPDYRRRKVVGSATRRAGQAGRDQRDCGRAEQRRTLGTGGTTQRNHGSLAEVSMTL
jgi:pimeloyl-ACP methyl ester carboxylesterase